MAQPAQSGHQSYDPMEPGQRARHGITRGDEHGRPEHPPADLETDRLAREAVKKADLLPHIRIVGQALGLPLRQGIVVVRRGRAPDVEGRAAQLGPEVEIVVP